MTEDLANKIDAIDDEVKKSHVTDILDEMVHASVENDPDFYDLSADEQGERSLHASEINNEGTLAQLNFLTANQTPANKERIINAAGQAIVQYLD